MNPKEHSWYVQITFDVLVSKELTPTQKLIIGLVANLMKGTGYCYGSNDYMGGCLGLSASTMSNNISALVEAGWLSREIVYDEKGQIKERRIWVVERKQSALSPEEGAPLSPEKVIPLSPEEVIPLPGESDTPTRKRGEGITGESEYNNKEANNKVEYSDVVVNAHAEGPWKLPFKKITVDDVLLGRSYQFWSAEEFGAIALRFGDGKYPEEMLEAFIGKWTQRAGSAPDRMRFQQQTSWDMDWRLRSWAKKRDLFDNHKTPDNGNQTNRTATNAANGSVKKGTSAARVERLKDW